MWRLQTDEVVAHSPIRAAAVNGRGRGWAQGKGFIPPPDTCPSSKGGASLTALSAECSAPVLRFLGEPAAPPSIPALAALVRAHTESVPWESASRIVRRAMVAATVDCPRWPEIFWAEAMTRGHGGTCFESNYAFFALLRALGYQATCR